MASSQTPFVRGCVLRPHTWHNPLPPRVLCGIISNTGISYLSRRCRSLILRKNGDDSADITMKSVAALLCNLQRDTLVFSQFGERRPGKVCLFLTLRLCHLQIDKFFQSGLYVIVLIRQSSFDDFYIVTEKALSCQLFCSTDRVKKLRRNNQEISADRGFKEPRDFRMRKGPSTFPKAEHS